MRRWGFEGVSVEFGAWGGGLLCCSIFSSYVMTGVMEAGIAVLYYTEATLFVAINPTCDMDENRL